MLQRKPVLLKDIQPNTYYDSPIWLDETFFLLSPEVPVTQSLLENLQEWGYIQVWMEGMQISSSPADVENNSSSVLNNDAMEAEGRQKAKLSFESLSRFTLSMYNKFSRNENLDIRALTERVKLTIKMLREYRPYMLRLSDLVVDNMDYLITHSARTMIIALTIGDTLKLPNFRLIELGIAALLHEIGMLQIPQKLREKSEPLTDTEKKIIATHPKQGMQMLRVNAGEKSNPLVQDILMGIWQHHERVDGSGYPQGLSDDSITLFGKILAAACSYDAKISKRPYRNAMDSHTSILTMLKGMHSLYDEKVISALIASISIYPLGSYVRLENNSIGMVVDTGEKHPKYPVVKLLLDPNLNPFKHLPLVKTQEADGLSIVSVLSNEEINDFTSQGFLPR